MADEPAAKGAVDSAAEPAAAPHPVDRKPGPQAPESGAPAAKTEELPEASPDDIQRRTDPFRDSYLTNFSGNVYAESIQIGPGNERRRLLFRTINDDEVDAALRDFVDPPQLNAAAAVLTGTRLVLLGGLPRSGRRCAAIALLDQGYCVQADTARAISELSPSITMAELLDLPFVRGGRYLLRGFAVDEVDDQLHFDARELAHRLRETGAYLVITSEARATGAFGDNSVSWAPVDCRDVLAAHLRSTGPALSAEEHDSLAEVAQHLHPHEMPGFLAALHEAGVSAAAERFRRNAHGDLTQWLDGPPPLSEVVPVITAALLPGVTEEAHERHAADLARAIDAFCQPDPRPREYLDELKPSRSARPTYLRVEDHRDLSPERAVALRHGIEPEVVFAELGRRYGSELWTPLTTWLDERADLVTFREEAALASAIPALWGVDRRRAGDVLDGWAESVTSGRVAARAVSALCVDDQGITEALHIAIRWSSRGRAQKITAAFAFGQQLSVEIPVEALSRLWHLALSESYVARHAAIQFAATVRALSGNAQRLRLALSLIDQQLDHVTTTRRDGVLIDRAVGAVATILAVMLPQRASLTTHVLQEVPDQIGHVGRLWAQVLQSWEHRNVALAQLAGVGEAAKSDRDRARFADLRAAARERLDPAEWRWVERDLGTYRMHAALLEGAVL